MNIKKILDKSNGKITFDNISHLDFKSSIEKNIDDLKEDMLQIEYPNNLLLDVGWFPSFNPKGDFSIQIIKDFDWENPILKKECHNFDTFSQSLLEVILFANNDCKLS